MSMEKIAEEKRELIRYLTKLAAARIIEDEMLQSWIKSANEEVEKTASTDQEQALAYLVQLGAETLEKQAQTKEAQDQVLQELLKRTLADQLQKEATRKGKGHDPATNTRHTVNSLLDNIESAGGIGSQVDPYTSAVNKLQGYIQAQGLSGETGTGDEANTMGRLWGDFLNRKGSANDPKITAQQIITALQKQAAAQPTQEEQLIQLFKQAGILDQIPGLIGGGLGQAAGAGASDIAGRLGDQPGILDQISGLVGGGLGQAAGSGVGDIAGQLGDQPGMLEQIMGMAGSGLGQEAGAGAGDLTGQLGDLLGGSDENDALSQLRSMLGGGE